MPRRSSHRATGVYAIVAGCYVAFVLFGSLLPFVPRRGPLPDWETIARAVWFAPVGIGERADVVANLLLFIPLGFLVAALSGRGRASASRPALATCACTMLSCAIELTQIVIVDRTPSLNDVAVDAAGAAIGATLWQVVGGELNVLLRWWHTRIGRWPAPRRALRAYAAALAIAWLLPLDMTISPQELDWKYRSGMMRLWPSDAVEGWARTDVVDAASTVVLGVPLGVLAVVGWTRRDTRRSVPRALVVATAAIALLLLAQLTVLSRMTDLVRFVVLGAGAALAILTAPLWDRSATARRADRDRLPGRLVVSGWTLALMAWSWFPFDFTFDGTLVRARMLDTSALPFRDFAESPSAARLGHWAGVFAIGFALPFIMARREREGRLRLWRLRVSAMVAAAIGLSSLLAAGRLALPGRPPDVTEIGLAAAGVALSGWLAARLPRSRPQDPSRSPRVYRHVER